MRGGRRLSKKVTRSRDFASSSPFLLSSVTSKRCLSPRLRRVHLHEDRQVNLRYHHCDSPSRDNFQAIYNFLLELSSCDVHDNTTRRLRTSYSVQLNNLNKDTYETKHIIKSSAPSASRSKCAHPTSSLAFSPFFSPQSLVSKAKQKPSNTTMHLSRTKN